MPPNAKKSLSHRLLGQALLAALALGLLLASAQIAHAIWQTRQILHREGEQLLAIYHAPASLASERAASGMARQLVEGLLAHPGVRQASIRDLHGTLLASRERPHATGTKRWLSDRLLGGEQHFATRLSDPALAQMPYGDLKLSLDPAYKADELRASALFILTTSPTCALLLGLALFLLYHWHLTRPLAELLDQLARINPERPDAQQLPRPHGHEQDELGQWADSTNRLLATIARQQAQRREAEDHLQRLSQFDQLTGLPSRQLLHKQLAHLLLEANRSQERVAVLCFGLDAFKRLNDQYGYQVGDRLLLGVAERLRSLDQRLGGLARLGGDQFALIQRGFQHNYEVADLTQQILDLLGRPQQVGRHEIRLEATAGIALFPDDGDDSEHLLQRAEQTMALAKQGARNRYQFFSASLDREIRRRRQLEEDLRLALHNGQLELYYQPQVAGSTQHSVAVEALLRWRHPQLGFVPPDQFIPLAEQNDLILEIGDWVLERACRQLRDWHQQGLDGLRMAVNLSTAQLRNTRLPRQVAGLLQRYGLPDYSLELEVTETGLMTDIDGAALQLYGLRLAKVLLAIDDFGTGYSSLSYLKSLPLDKIKIDRSFVRELPYNEDDATIVRSIIQLAHNLNMTVLAEGVETAEQEAYLHSQGCSESQGYLYCRPLPALEVTQYLFTTRRQPPSAVATRY